MFGAVAGSPRPQTVIDRAVAQTGLYNVGPGKCLGYEFVPATGHSQLHVELWPRPACKQLAPGKCLGKYLSHSREHLFTPKLVRLWAEHSTV